MVVTILRFTITLTTAVGYFRWVCSVVVLYFTCNSTVLLIVLVTAAAVETILGFTPHYSYYCHGLTV
jgi:hypothetical protein